MLFEAQEYSGAPRSFSELVPVEANAAPSQFVIPSTPPDAADLIEAAVNDRRSPNTRRAYAYDLRAFFRAFDAVDEGGNPQAARVREFLELEPWQIAQLLQRYKIGLMGEGLSESTVNRRLAAVKSLLKFGFRFGLSKTDGRGLVDSEKVESYRDTKGVDLATVKKILKLPAKLHGADSLHGRRDVAILRLLWENGLRRAEVSKLDVSDFQLRGRRLAVLGKGKGTAKRRVDLSGKCAAAIALYLQSAEHDDGPLFRNLHHDPTRRRKLTGGGLYYLVSEYGRAAGVEGLTPHQFRHSAITIYLTQSNGNTRAAREFSRHTRPETLLLYDHARQRLQLQVTDLLSSLA